jgi:indole-3-glycerol phosphate synthase
MNRPDILAQIAEKVEARLAARKAVISYDELIKKKTRMPRDFTGQLRGGVKIIAEIKFRSPSQSESGHSSTVENAVKIAGSYLSNGASALSVLTEEDHFNGSLKYLQAIRQAYPDSFLLMKDFFVDEYQLQEALVFGADCILLIVALLEKDRLKALYKRALQLGLSILVEVHNEGELQVAIELGSKLIGVNNRNLKNLQISLDTSRRLAKLAPESAVLVCESGIEKVSEISEMSALGFSGFLIGTSLMKTNDPGKTLAGLLGELRAD